MSIARGLLETTPHLIADNDGSTILRFVPHAWADLPNLKPCPLGEWTRTCRHLLSEIKTYNSALMLDRVNVALASTDVGRIRNADRQKDAAIGAQKPGKQSVQAKPKKDRVTAKIDQLRALGPSALGRQYVQKDAAEWPSHLR